METTSAKLCTSGDNHGPCFSADEGGALSTAAEIVERKDKYKNKGKHGDGSKGKDRDSNWNTSQQAAQIQGFVFTVRCGTTHVQSADNDWLNSTKLVQLLKFQNTRKKVAHRCIGAMLKMMNWRSIRRVSAAVTTPTGLAGTLLVDSGAYDNFSHPEFAKECPSKKNTRLML